MTEAAARRAHRVSVWAIRLGVVLVPVGLWAFMTSTGRWDSLILASPQQLWTLLVDWFSSGYIYPHLLQTLYEAGVGFLIGALAGAVVALVFGMSSRLYKIFAPLIVAGNAIPRIVLAPIFALWLGFGPESKVALVALMVFFPNFFNVFKGIRSIDVTYIDSARSLGASRLRLVGNVHVPSTVVWVLASLRVSVGFAFLAAIVAEYVGATQGLGFVIAGSSQTGQIAGVFCGILVIMAVVLPIDLVLTRLDRRIERWRPREG